MPLSGAANGWSSSASLRRGKFFDVHFAFAAEVNHLAAFEISPVSDDAGSRRALDELG